MKPITRKIERIQVADIPIVEFRESGSKWNLQVRQLCDFEIGSKVYDSFSHGSHIREKYYFIDFPISIFNPHPFPIKCKFDFQVTGVPARGAPAGVGVQEGAETELYKISLITQKFTGLSRALYVRDCADLRCDVVEQMDSIHFNILNFRVMILCGHHVRPECTKCCSSCKRLCKRCRTHPRKCKCARRLLQEEHGYISDTTSSSDASEHTQSATDTPSFSHSSSNSSE